MDILSATGFLNHFGRVQQNDNIEITPLLFQKGYTKLALYGLANVRDERLFRTFRDRNVKFLRPSIQQNEWFSLMAVHQNRNPHSETDYLPENFLPDFLNLIIWGHEHECRIDPEANSATGFDVIQPGSSIATSLCQAEAKDKFNCILSINKNDYAVEKVRLKTVRPFMMEDIVLSRDSTIPKDTNNTKAQVTAFLIERVEQLIDEAKRKWINAQQFEDDQEINTDDPKIPLPLIRITVEYTGYEVENPRRFSNRFVGSVANVNDVVQFYKKRTYAQGAKRGKSVENGELEIVETTADKISIEDLLDGYLKQEELELFPENGFNEAVKNFVEKEDKTALKT